METKTEFQDEITYCSVNFYKDIKEKCEEFDNS